MGHGMTGKVQLNTDYDSPGFHCEVTFFREVMGATNPKHAAPGTIRAIFAETIDESAVHGSDGPDTAKTEIAFFSKPTKSASRSVNQTGFTPNSRRCWEMTPE